MSKYRAYGIGAVVVCIALVYAIGFWHWLVLSVLAMVIKHEMELIVIRQIKLPDCSKCGKKKSKTQDVQGIVPPSFSKLKMQHKV